MAERRHGGGRRQSRGTRDDKLTPGDPVGHDANSYGSGLRTGSEIVDYDVVSATATPPMSRAISIDTIRDAARTVYDAAVRTPLVPLGATSAGGPEIFLKLEMLQPIGSFKIRGAYNDVRRLSPTQLAEGVWTVSAGNAAQGVALAARKAGARCSVMVMDTAPEAKLGAIHRLGATIVKASFDECWTTVESHGSARMTGHFVHPFDDDDFISGNGTAGAEVRGNRSHRAAVRTAARGGGGRRRGRPRDGVARPPEGGGRRVRRQRRPRQIRAARRRVSQTPSLKQNQEPDETARTNSPLARVGDRSLVDVERASARGLPPPRLPAVATNGAQPRPAAAQHLGGAPGATRKGRPLPRRLRRGDRGAGPCPQRAGHLVAAPFQRQPRPDRLLFGGVRAAPVASDLRRRPRRAPRRSLQRTPRSWRPRHPRRLQASAGRLPSERVAGRLAEGIVRTPELGQRTDRTRCHGRRQDVHRPRAARQPQRAGAGVARTARPREAVSAGHRPPRKRALGPRTLGTTVRRGPRGAHPARAHAHPPPQPPPH